MEGVEVVKIPRSPQALPKPMHNIYYIDRYFVFRFISESCFYFISVAFGVEL